MIRSASLQDIEKIQNIATASWWPVYEPIVGKEQVHYMLTLFYSREALSKLIEEGFQKFLILEIGALTVGFAAYSPLVASENEFKLNKLYLLPEQKGKGYGLQLLQAVEHQAAQANGTKLILNVNRENPSMQFYLQAGYSILYEESIPVGPYFMNDYVMGKSL